MKLQSVIELLSANPTKVAKRMGWHRWQYIDSNGNYVDGDVIQKFFALGSEIDADDWYIEEQVS